MQVQIPYLYGMHHDVSALIKTLIAVAQALYQSVWKQASVLQLLKSIVNGTMKEDLKLHFFKLPKVQEVKKTDYLLQLSSSFLR